MILGKIGTVLTNGDAIAIGGTVLPALTPYDAISDSLSTLLDIGIPFFLGFSLARTRKDLLQILGAIITLMLVYAIPILWEVRMSPNLHRFLYGYHAQPFGTTIRLGGYRPTVFTQSGIVLSLFVMMACIASAGMVKARERLGAISMKPILCFFCLLVVIVKSLGSIIYTCAAIPLLLLARPRTQLLVACCLSVLIVTYPITRSLGIFPVAELTDLATQISEDRALSLAFRFHNEDLLLKKALERPLFGWGPWGRSRLYDPDTGRDIAVTDGYWVIEIGSSGWVGFLCSFGMLLLPLFLAFRNLDKIRSVRSRYLLAALGTIVLMVTIDLLPNGFLNPLWIFLAGAVASLSKSIHRQELAIIRRQTRRAH